MCTLDISDIIEKAPDIYKLLNLLADKSAQWYSIGICLRVPDNYLESIQQRLIIDIHKRSAVINI